MNEDLCIEQINAFGRQDMDLRKFSQDKGLVNEVGKDLVVRG